MADNIENILPRVEALRQAASLISGSRDADYGGPYDNFGRIAEFWSTESLHVETWQPR